MIAFLLKKTFFDLWDNALRLALLNIGFIVSAALFFFFHRLLEYFSPLPAAVSGLVFFSGIIWNSVYLTSTAVCVKNISDYKTFSLDDFFTAFRSAWAAGITYGIFLGAAAVLFAFVMPFFLLLNTATGLFAASLLFWTLVILAAVFQYFFAVYARLGKKDSKEIVPERNNYTTKFTTTKFTENPNIKSIKKSFLLFIDNPLFFFGTMLLAFFFFAVSIVSAFLLPGPAGILLFLDEALRLRLLKYDWLEQNSGSDRRYIPWDTILSGEREKTGNRTLRALIFPWKD
jgi:hypothetical protein